MKKILFLITVIVLSIGIQAKEKVNVLYVGGSPDINSYGVGTTDSVALARSVKMRTEDFARFLKRHFTKVTTVNGKDYTPAMSDGYDVTVFDGRPTPIRPKIEERDENGRIIKYARPAYLPDDFDRAVVCIAEASEDMGRSIGTKNDWFCLCLNNYALGWDKQHPIFKGPFKVDIVSEMRPTPEHAREYCPIYGYTLPEQTEMWLVHTPATPENSMRIGMVSRPGGYLDSPDTEIISGGECAKSIDAIAIGRHGNFFHWGFAAKPSDLTEPAKAALANAIVYMKDFNGKRVIARKLNENIATRQNAVAAKYIASRACCEANNRMNMEHYLMTDSVYKVIEAKKSTGEQLSPSEKFYAQYPKPEKPEPTTYSDYLKQREPRLYHIFGEDEEEYARYYDKNTPWFYPTANGYDLDIDEDVRSLGIANNDIRLLDKAVELLRSGGQDAEMGKRILERYTLCRFSTPEEWAKWLADNRDRMFFTESGGWLWLVNTPDPSVPGNDYSVLSSAPEAITETKPAGLTDKDNPVALSATVVDTADGLKEIIVTMTVHDGFHTYAMLADEDPFIPTEVSIELPDGYDKIGSLVLPATSPSSTATTYYTGTGTFRQRIKGSGSGKVTCKIRYQACDSSMCMPPVTKTFELDL